MNFGKMENSGRGPPSPRFRRQPTGTLVPRLRLGMQVCQAPLGEGSSYGYRIPDPRGSVLAKRSFADLRSQAELGNEREGRFASELSPPSSWLNPAADNAGRDCSVCAGGLRLDSDPLPCRRPTPDRA